MAEASLAALYEHYPEIIHRMPAVFDSQQFVQVLAREHQQLYIDVLHSRRDAQQNGQPAPFAVVNGLLAERLHEFPHLIAPDGNILLKDMFGRPNGFERWRKLETR